MKTRKLVLIITDLLLLALCLIQGIAAARDGAKYFKYDDSPDEITIVTPSENLLLTKDGDDWFVTEQKYPANGTVIDNFIEATKEIRALDKVASVNDNSRSKYELVETKEISVEIKKGGKLLRSLEIGKEPASSSQAYITVDGGNDIYLASGSLRATFNTSLKSLRSRVIWGFDKETVNSLSVTKADGTTWSLSRMGEGDSTSWTISISDAEVDSEKASTVLQNAATLTTTSWYGDDVKADDLGGEFLLSAKIGHDYESASIEIYQILPKTEDSGDGDSADTADNSSSGETKYYATCSESPYVFELASYAVEKFNKNAEDLVK